MVYEKYAGDERRARTVDAIDAALGEHSESDLAALAGATGAKSTRGLAKRLALLVADELPFERTCSSARADEFVPRDIAASRRRVRQQFLALRDDAASATPDDLERMFGAYDREWFDGHIARFFRERDYTLRFETSEGDGFGIVGECAETCDYVVTIPTRMFADARRGTVVAGIACSDALDCLMRVFEHELTHLIIFTFCDSEYMSDQHSPLFQATTRKLFGHTQVTHHLTSGAPLDRA